MSLASFPRLDHCSIAGDRALPRLPFETVTGGKFSENLEIAPNRPAPLSCFLPPRSRNTNGRKHMISFVSRRMVIGTSISSRIRVRRTAISRIPSIPRAAAAYNERIPGRLNPCGIARGPVRNCYPCLTLILLLVSERDDGANPPSWSRCLGFGPTPAPDREGWESREFGDGLPAIGRETRSSRGRFPMPGLRRPVGSPGPVSKLRWRFGSSVADSDARTVGAWTLSPGDCGSPPDLPDAASMRPSWPGCWPCNGSRVASWRSPSWISRSRRPGRSVGRCTGRSLGAGGSRPLGSRGNPSRSGPSVGSWRVGADRPSSSWRWTIGPSSASPGSRPPGAWIHWSGPGWSQLRNGRACRLSLRFWTLPWRRVDVAGGRMRGVRFRVRTIMLAVLYAAVFMGIFMAVMRSLAFLETHSTIHSPFF